MTSSLGISRWKNMSADQRLRRARRIGRYDWLELLGRSTGARAAAPARMIEISKRERFLPAGILRLRLFAAGYELMPYRRSQGRRARSS